MKTVYKPEDDNRSHLKGWRYIEGWRSELPCWGPREERWPRRCTLTGNRLIRSRILGWSGCPCCSWVGSRYLRSPREGSRSPANAAWSRSASSQFQLCCLEEGKGAIFISCNQRSKRNLGQSKIKRIFQILYVKASSSAASAYSLISTGSDQKRKKIFHPVKPLINQAILWATWVWRSKYEKIDETFSSVW